MRFVGFIGPSYVSQSVNVDCQRCMNLYPELDSLGTGKAGEVASLVSTPGLTSLLTLPASPVRGMFYTSTGALYAAAGQYLYKIASDWTHTQIGQLNTDSGNVSMADNGLQLVAVDGTDGYSVTLSDDTFAQITDPNFLTADTVTYQDGYFIFNKSGTQYFYCSDLLAITFTALNTAAKSGSADNLVAVLSFQQNLCLFGSQTTEIWYDSGDTPCPFTRIQGAVLHVGCSAPFSIAKNNAGVFFLGGDDTGSGIVYQMQGFQPKRISTPSIESLIRSVGSSNIANAKAWTYQQAGHMFYCLNVPGLSSTWVYDASTNLWHERTYLGSWGFERHRADVGTLAFGKTIVGDYSTGDIYELSSDTLTDNSKAIVRQRAAPHLTKDLNFIVHSKFQLDMETGVGLDGTGQGTDPLAVLDWSDDGGHTWSNEHQTSIGKIGETKTRAIWRRLGASRDRVYRVTISEPVKVTLIGADIDTAEGAA